MIKYFCDRCGKESKIAYVMDIYAYDALDIKIVQLGYKHLCEECAKKLATIKDQLKHEQDILDMTDEEIELLRYTFKVGDKVITDDGRVGTITSICGCEKCKERGFYEPKVKMDVGVDQIWITDTDKKDGFRSFYQIGDRVFGSVDAEASKCIRERITELEYEVIQYKTQLNMIKKLENNNGN